MSVDTRVQAPDLDVLAAIERRVLWIAIAMIHHANASAKGAGVKIGGHQASSASMATIMTTLWFGFLRADDRVSVKPHASPVLHAINYLLGLLDVSFLTRLRGYEGLQSYPSRSKDPDRVDFSTGSVGIGATATIWSAIANRYVTDHFDAAPAGRHIALLGDAELDEGAIWEAVIDPMSSRLGDVLWVVDVNRQSLDRVVPDIAVGRLAGMFESAGWHCQIAKWGRGLEELFLRDNGELLRRRLEAMPNEEYQRLLRADSADIRERLPGFGDQRKPLARFIDDLDDGELRACIRDLGGHDPGTLLKCLDNADGVGDRPSVIFAYTIKARRLATEGHPSNHAALLTDEQVAELAHELGLDVDDPWCVAPPDADEAVACAAAAERLFRARPSATCAASIPAELGREHVGSTSTQQALGRVLVGIDREYPEAAKRIVTASPDVASSTNLAGWINRVGVWSVAQRVDWFADDPKTLVRWVESGRGRHIELGIAEVNLVGLLGELGATWDRDGVPLLPVGTIYDPFVARALEPWSFGMYAGGQSILIGTPSGVSLAPEGGAHQSIITPSIGIEQPGCIAYEPAFAQDFEWTFLHALSRLGRPDGASAYFRLSTKPIDQALAQVPRTAEQRGQRRREVIAGGYRLRAPKAADVMLVGVGAVMPEVLGAADELAGFGGLQADVICLTSPDLVFRAQVARQGRTDDETWILDALFPRNRAVPLVTVIDGHPHTLSFLAGIHGVPTASLGVAEFGQSGTPGELYAHFGIDTDTIVGTALDLVD